MRVYAVVGGIAAGKSTVARRMARRHGGAVLDADRAGHAVLRLAPVRRRLLAAFGPDILGRGGEVDRTRLGARVFGRPAALRRLNAIVHPEIARVLEARLARHARRGTPFVLVDAALYFEFAWRRVDGVLAVVAPRRARAERLQKRSGLGASAVAARLRSQPRLEHWIRAADVVLDSDCPLPELGARIENAWKALQRLGRTRQGRNARGTTRGSRRSRGSSRPSQGVPLMSRRWNAKRPRSRSARARLGSGTTRRRRARSSAG
jgi:dephospho-CoA kinase